MNDKIAINKTAIRDASTIVVLRDRISDPHVLMGQRGSNAAFMPDKFVFPGGAIDSEDANIQLATNLNSLCKARLMEDTVEDLSNSLAVAAIRELWEESGLVLGKHGNWTCPPPTEWRAFAATGHVPVAHPLQFIFRAITPAGRPRRFDARFFLVDASDISGDLDDFSAASDELSHLQWIPLPKARDYDLPFITEVVLAEVAARTDDMSPLETVPFFKNNDEASLFVRLRGYSPKSDE
ncbi:MAG: NUDIX hydrolase [Roseovarius sp.]|nr:NUDIX hydrolase [Roseovarius sp.]MCY4208980.1 NUDIX hydrolase [Roseovarius sp.]MCY4290467.1 NUDIX hydrolase [Roseovarius sp.]MCY4315503.1 NUDIX hydrolase [Roseovarius sp.]